MLHVYGMSRWIDDIFVEFVTLWYVLYKYTYIYVKFYIHMYAIEDIKDRVSQTPHKYRKLIRGSSIFLHFLYARLKNGTYYAVAMSVRLSVRPSVRPRFLGFSSTCFETSIWNLVYTFSRWHDMSSLSCITIGSFWPSLQPKVGQTHFLQSWPHKSR